MFGVPSGKLLNFLVSRQGIEANPDKIKAIENMKSLTKLKKVQKLTGYMAPLVDSWQGWKNEDYPFQSPEETRQLRVDV